MQHCPSDCHSHIIETFSGVKSGTFEAPDHEYPSHLLLSVDVTDFGRPDRRTPRSSCSRRREPWPPRPRRPGSRSRSGRRPGRRPRPPPGSSSRRSASSAPATALVGESTLRVRPLVGRRRADPRRDDRARGDLGGRDLQAHRRRAGPLQQLRLVARAGDPVRDLAARPVREPRRRRLVSLQADVHDPGPADPGRPHRRRPDDAVQRLHQGARGRRTSAGPPRSSSSGACRPVRTPSGWPAAAAPPARPTRC